MLYITLFKILFQLVFFYILLFVILKQFSCFFSRILLLCKLLFILENKNTHKLHIFAITAKWNNTTYILTAIFHTFHLKVESHRTTLCNSPVRLVVAALSAFTSYCTSNIYDVDAFENWALLQRKVDRPHLAPNVYI